MAIDTTAAIAAANRLAERYGTEVNPKLVSSINNISTINSKYQLPAGTENDFNNAATFLVNATYKDSATIDAGESDQSATFGAKLLKYFNSELTVQDVRELALFAKNYNDEIGRRYPMVSNDSPNEYNDLDDAGKRAYIKDIFGIDPDTLEIDEYGIASAFRTSISNQYKPNPGDQLTEYDGAIISMITAHEIARRYLGAEDGAIEWSHCMVLSDGSIDNPVGYANAMTSSDRDKVDNATTASEISAILGGTKTHYLAIKVENPFFKGNYAYLKYGSVSDQIIMNGSDIGIADRIKQRISYYYYDAESKKWNPGSVSADMERIFKSDGITIAAYVMNYGTTLKKIIAANQKTIISKIGIISDADESRNEYIAYSDASDDDTISLSKTIGQKKPFAYIMDDDGHISTSIDNANGIQNSIAMSMLSIAIRQRKIHCAAAYSNIVPGQSIDGIMRTSKLCADSIETMNAISYGMPLVIRTNNIPVAINSSAYAAIKEFAGGESASTVDINGTKYAVVSFSIAYKEFNPEIRKIAGSVISDMIMGYLSMTDSKLDSTISVKYSSAVSQMKKGTLTAANIMMGDSDAISVAFGDLHSNPYIIRNSAADDMIAYYAGNSISFGTAASDKEDIETLIILYKSCRDYFYKTLMNKSFIHDEKYGMFVRYFIKYLTIDRFMNARLDNAHNIDKFTLNDCESFMESYGLEELSQQIRSKYFQSATEYSKRIIANYSDLMSYKGSRHDIEKCAKLLESDSGDLTLYKYTLAKQANDSGNGSDLKFVMTEYSAENINHELTNSFSASADYSAFVADDSYWDDATLTKSIVSRKMNSPQTTKYIGMLLSSDLYKDYITTQVSLAVNRYINDNAPIGSEGIFGLSGFRGVMPSGTAFGSIAYDYGLDVKIAVLQLMWKYYVRLNECLAFEKKPNQAQATEKTRYFGINKNAPDLKALFDGLGINDELRKMILLKWNGLKYADASSDDCSMYMLGNMSSSGYGYPGTDIVNMNTQFDQTIGNNMPYLIPVDMKSQGQDRAAILNSSDYAAFDNLFSEYHNEINGNSGIDVKKHETTMYAYDCQISAVNDALEAASAIQLIKKLSDGSDSSADVFKALYYYYKYGGLQSDYKDGDEYDLEKDLDVTSYYEYLYSKIATFAVNYLTGEYGDSSGGGYDADVKKILDTVYSEYFTVNDSLDSAMRYIDGEEDYASQLKYELDKITNDDHGDELISVLKELKVIDSAAASDVVKPIEYDRADTKDDILIKQNGDAPNLISESDARSIMSNLLANIGEMSNQINGYYLAYDEQQIHMVSAEDTDNEFEFTRAMIQYFMSYTAYLYSATNTHDYDTKHERLEMASGVSDEIENDVADHAFYDYDITINESAKI